MLRSTLMALLLLAAPAAKAADIPPAMWQYIYADLMLWINDAEIVAAVLHQNDQNRELSDAHVITGATAYHAQVDSAEASLSNAAVNEPLSAFLRNHLEQAQGRISSVTVLDSSGLPVASSGLSPELWHRDQAQFQSIYSKGSGAVIVDMIKLDKTTQTYQGQVSYALTDPATGLVIGVITVGLNVGAFD